MTALGQGNFDALFVALGMIVGSYLERGELLLPQIMRFFAWQGVLTAV
jgi:hypothetical protein